MGFSTIDDAFWMDQKLMKLNMAAKFVFFWLITNPTRHYTGVFYLQGALLERDTRCSPSTLRDALDTLEKSGFIKRDKELGIVWVVNMFKYQTGRAAKLSPQQVGGLKKHLTSAPYVHSELVWFFCKKYEYLGLPQFSQHTPIIPVSDTPYVIGTGNLIEADESIKAIKDRADSIYIDDSLKDAPPPPTFRPKDLIALYNDINPHDRKQDTLSTDKRKEKARVRIMTFPHREFWMQVFHKVKQSSFLRCLNGNRWNGGRGADLDWLLLNDNNPAKVWEGKYDDSGSSGGGAPDPYAGVTTKIKT